ncbi:MAG TPA: hypothetical protein VIZ28_10360 [Chitinophagaceae bacterium]
MKKIVLVLTAMLLLSGVAAYAGGGKKKAKKAARKNECCIPTPNCDIPKCNSVKYTEGAAAGKAEESKPACCPDPSSCSNKG